MADDGRRIRPFTEADAGIVAEIYNETIRMGDASMDRVEKTAQDILGWQREFNQREGLYILELDGAVAGWGIIKRYSDRQAYSVACETAVYLHRSMRGRGLGTYIKLHLIEKCRELGYHHLVAKIFADNEASIQYNLKLGYELVGIQREIGWLDGHWQDVAILQLVLGDVPPDAAVSD